MRAARSTVGRSRPRGASAAARETTHTGGHRFAATAVLLPDGLALGRLDRLPPGRLATELAAGRVPASALRGRCATPGPVQAAEALARAELAVDERDGLLPTSWEQAGDTTTVRLRTTDGTRVTAVVRTAPAAPPRPISDGAAPTSPAAHVLVRLATDGHLDDGT